MSHHSVSQPYIQVTATGFEPTTSLAKWLSVCLRTKCLWFESRCCHLNLDMAPASSKKFLGIQATIVCRFTLKLVRDMIITYSLIFLLANIKPVFRKYSSKYSSKYSLKFRKFPTCEICEISKYTQFYRTPPVAASADITFVD